MCEHAQVVWELVVRGDDDPLAARVELGPARASEDLLHVEHTQLAECALLGIIHLGSVEGG